MQKTSVQKKIIPVFRRIMQVIGFVLVPSLFIQIFNSFKTIFMFIFHGNGTLFTIIPNLVILIIITIVTKIAGRFFCGWMCAFGGLSDFLYRIPRIGSKKLHKYHSNKEKYLKSIKYIILTVIIVFVWGFQIITVPFGTNPWDLFGILVSFRSRPLISNLISGWLPAAIILFVIMTLSVFIERFFCRYLCPLGAYFAIVSKGRILAIEKLRSNCGKCSLCTVKCGMGIDLTMMDSIHSGDCINCMECTLSCPKGNANLKISGRSLNAVVVGMLSCVIFIGAYYFGNFTINNSSSPVIPTYPQDMEYVDAGIAVGLPDGTYTGSGMGFRGETEVSVKVSDSIITDITVQSTSDDKEYVNKASHLIIAEIISNQSTDVDLVSGATYSSNAIVSAVKNALFSQSSSDGDFSSAVAADDASDSSISESINSSDSVSNSSQFPDLDKSLLNIKDGTYTGSGTGFKGETNVTVTVKDGNITDININSYNDDPKYFESAASAIIQEIINKQSVDVDAVSGATYSSNSICEAVADALSLSYTDTTVTDVRKRNLKRHGR